MAQLSLFDGAALAPRVDLGGGRGALAMRVAHACGMTAIARRLRLGHGCLLTFHRVAAGGTWADLPNRNFHLDAGFLGALLDHLVATGWAVVTMEEAVSRIRDRDGGRFVNFSIDDGYRDTAEVAIPIFRRRNLPVTVFVTTGIPDRTMSMWTAGLETILLEQPQVTLEDGSSQDTGTPAARRALFARLCAAWETAAAAERYSRFCALNGYATDVLHDRHALTWEMLDTLRDDPGVEIGGHTMTHPHLSQLPQAEARAEIAGCRARLRERLRIPARHFAYPFGQAADCGPREFSLAAEAGFVSAATTRKGLVGARGRGTLHALPRNMLNGAHQHVDQAEVHLSGLGGLVAGVLRAT